MSGHIAPPGALLLDPPPRRIAVFRALFLGDLLCATPALRALRQRFPAAEITLIGLPWARELVDRLPSLDRLALFPGYPGLAEAPYDAARTAAFLREARAARYDLAIQLHGDGNSSNGFVAQLGARATLGFRRDECDDRLTASLVYDRAEHEVLRWLRLFALLGADASDTRLAAPVPTADDEAVARALLAPLALAGGPLVGLHPGAKDPARRWPPECFAALADTLAARYGAQIVLTGVASERATTAAVRRLMHAPALDLAGATGIGSLTALVASLDLLIANDTGVAHLAVATETPSVHLIGPGQPDEWLPLDRARHQVVDARQLAAPNVDAATALRELPVAPVVEACARVIGPHPLSPSPVRGRVGTADALIASSPSPAGRERGAGGEGCRG
ncbi:MAG: glycosyltransferase family 9 protein [Thermomicrobiales bacterium]